ncbi:MAG: hypothetical protein ACXVC3_07625 [Bdellovibrio sp.]
MIDDEVPIILRGPASENTQSLPVESRARVQSVIDNKTLVALSTFFDWRPGEIVGLESQSPGIGIIAFLEVRSIENKQDGTYEITCELVRQSRMNFIQTGDQLIHLDLTSSNDKYKGTTDLIVKKSNHNISSKYKPLFTQSITAGETAQTLWEDEYLVNWYGQVSYGIKDWLTFNTVLPLDFLGGPNAAAKARVFESFSNVVSTGLTFVKIPNETRSTLNLNVYWDSISSESVISHTLLSVALFSFEQAQDATAIKSLGTSSFQTGYEFILNNWDRLLIGPNYNFEKKAVGGYLTYVRIWDKFHLSFSLNSTNIASLKYAPVDGYYLAFDAYWRF